MPGIQRSSAFFCPFAFESIVTIRICPHARQAQQSRRRELNGLQRLLSRIHPLRRRRRPCFPPRAYWKPVRPEPAKFAVCRRSLPPIQPARQHELARSSQKMLRKPSKSFGCIVVSLLPPSTACIGVSSNRAHSCSSCRQSRHECASIAGLNTLGASGSPMTSKSGRFYTS